jgi:iron complex outermembrane receptor protein
MSKWNVSLLFVLSIGILADAQTSPSGDKETQQPTIEPIKTSITVTATRSPMEVEKTPVSTSLVAHPEMEERNIQQVDQALSLLEGVNVSRGRGIADSEVGVGLRGFAGIGGQARTLVLVDGQPVNDSYTGAVNWSSFAVSEMERVEVARGPFSSLYGGNAMGGVINLITRPIDRRRVEIFGQYGSRDTTTYSVRYADRVMDRLGFSVGYNRLQNGGYANREVLRTTSTSLTGGTPVTGVQRWLTTSNGATYQVGMRGPNWSNHEAFRGRVEYTFSPKLHASAQYLWQARDAAYDAYSSSLRDASGNVIDSGTVVFDDNGVRRRLSVTPYYFLGGPSGSRTRMYQGQVLATLNPRWNLRVAGGMNDTPCDWYVTPGSAATLNGGAGTHTNTGNKSAYGNIQASFQGEDHSFIAGTETRQDKADILTRSMTNYTDRTQLGNSTNQAGGNSINQAAYGQYQHTFFTRLNVIAGARWDYWRTYDGTAQASSSAALTQYSDRSDNALTGKIAASYAFSNAWQLRGSVGTAFRNPNIYNLYRDLLDGSTWYMANADLKPERLRAYEAGVTGNFRRWGVGATLFQNNISGLMYRVTDYTAAADGSVRRIMNAGMGRTRGAELTARQQFRRWLQFRQTYTYTASIITENDALPTTVGKRVPYVPKHTVAYSAIFSRQRWTLTWTGRYVSRMYSTDANTDVVRGVPGGYDPYFTTDGSISYKINRYLTWTASAENLIDRQAHLYYLMPGRTLYTGFRLCF